MIICMSDILCVTNRKLCKEDFRARIESIASAHPAGIILREKDLKEEEYRELAETVLAICEKQGTLCILHSFVRTARELKCAALHLPLDILKSLSVRERAEFAVLGASCHSVGDAVEAEKLGCTYITAGHIFETDCKRGLPGRGTSFLKEVCKSVSVPVYAIGGVCPGNMAELRSCGAAGACVMSGAMGCGDVQKYLSAFEEERDEI